MGVQKVDQKEATNWGIAPLKSIGFGVGPIGGAVSIYDLVCRDTFRAHRFTVSSGGGGIGIPKFPVSGSFTNDDFSYFTTKRPVAFPDFDGLRVNMTSSSAGIYSWSTLTIFDKDDSHMANLKWSGLGISIPELGSGGTGWIAMKYGNGRPVETPDWIMPNPNFQTHDIMTVERRTATSGDVLVVRGDVLFASGMSDLRDGAELALDQAYYFIRDHAEFLRISIEGHTDRVGGRVFNQGLSERRAEVVLKWFQWHIGQTDYQRRKWRSVGYGETQPVASNDNSKGRTKNRRVEIVLWRR